MFGSSCKWIAPIFTAMGQHGTTKIINYHKINNAADK